MKAQVNDNMNAPSETILPRCDVIPDIPISFSTGRCNYCLVGTDKKYF